MHAIARIVLHPILPNIQTSWVKMGFEGAQAALAAGVNDLGGSLMNESITRAAGATHGQEMTPPMLEEIICGAGLKPWMRTTLYQPAPLERRSVAFDPPHLSEVISTPIAGQRRRSKASA
jgi:FO synthase